MRDAFALLETMRWRPAEGLFLLDLHLARLERSARHFTVPLDQPAVRAALASAVAGLSPEPHRVRLLVGRDGAARVEAVPLAQLPLPSPLRVGLATHAIDPTDPCLLHKTTMRDVYNRARATRPDVDDVLLINGIGEVTESTIGNLVIERAGRPITPALACGLLPGVFREHLLARGDLEEAIVTAADLRALTTCFLINSVREWMPCRLIEAPQG